MGSKAIQGWASGVPSDPEATLHFAGLAGVRPRGRRISVREGFRSPSRLDQRPCAVSRSPDQVARAYCSLNWTVTVRWVAEGTPFSIAGWYFHCFTALVAASCNKAGPESTRVVVTRPVTSISASIVTLPPTRWMRAICGYTGGTDEISFATFTSPPTGNGAAGPLPLLSSMLKPLESAAVAPLISTPGSAVPFSVPAAFRVIFGAASRTSPSAGFFAGSAATRSSGLSTRSLAVVFPGVLTLGRVSLTEFCRTPDNLAAAGSRAGAADRLSASVALGLADVAAGLLTSGAGMLAGLLSATVPSP